VQSRNAAARSIYRTVGETSSFGGSPLEQHIGLGSQAESVDLDIVWPASGTRQHFAGVRKNQFIEIKEFASAYTHLERAPIQRANPRMTASTAGKPN